jgi:predicted phage baseplate assembly protein
VSSNQTLVLDSRTAQDFYSELTSTQPAFVPELQVSPEGTLAALLQMVARFSSVVTQRLNQAPHLDKLAFLDMLGISLIPAQPARAPVVFQPLPLTVDGSIPAGTRVGATPPGASNPTVFETENDIAMTAAQLTQVVSLWPDRDGYVDHSADLAGGRQFTLFQNPSPVEHVLYLSQQTLLAFKGKTTVEVRFTLATNGSEALSYRWEFWDGQTWRSFDDFDSTDPTASQDGTAGLTQSGTITLQADCGDAASTPVSNITNYWIRGRLTAPLPPDPSRTFAVASNISLRTTIERPLTHGPTTCQGTVQIDSAYAGNTSLDLTKIFYPLGKAPGPDAVFYFTSQEVFSKPGANVTLCIDRATTPEEQADGAGSTSAGVLSPPELVWEYYNGNEWQALLGPGSNAAVNLLKSGELSFTVPQDISPFTLNNSPVLGMRARLASGSYDTLLLVNWTDPTSGKTNSIPVLRPRPPALSGFAIGYTYRSTWTAPDQSLSWNDFVVESHTPTTAHPAANYAPYHPVADTLPALYLGFNQPLPNDYLSIFFDITESDTDGPPLVWEAWSAGTWETLTVSEDTGALARSGMAAFLDPGVPARPSANVTSASGYVVTAASSNAAAVFVAGDQIIVQPNNAAELVQIDSIQGATINLVTPLAGTYSNTTATLAALPRFGISLDWVRARLKTDGDPEISQVNGIYPNAVWADQVQTINNETLGSGTGQPNQSFFFQQFPVRQGEQVQVRELDGAQANVGFPALQEQLIEQGFTSADIRTVIDKRSGLITQVWVTWINQPNFYFSRPGDRHYVLDRASGRIIFGDGVNGMLPTVGNSNIVAYVYQAGGGLRGNVAAGAINQLLGGAVAKSVTNPAAAEGGADTEPTDEVSWRGPQVLRHRGSALSAADYQALALQASPGVAITRCLPATNAGLLPAPGWVTLILVPRSLDPQPIPSYELKQEVAQYIAERAPSTIESGRISVIPPDYLLIGVSAIVAARQIDESGAVKTAVVDALNKFFHPLYGGPEGRGWPFGRSVHLSDVAKLIEGIEGVDYVRLLELLLNSIPAGNTVTVPPERLVAAGTMLITMEGAPNA